MGKKCAPNSRNQIKSRCFATQSQSRIFTTARMREASVRHPALRGISSALSQSLSSSAQTVSLRLACTRGRHVSVATRVRHCAHATCVISRSAAEVRSKQGINGTQALRRAPGPSARTASRDRPPRRPRACVNMPAGNLRASVLAPSVPMRLSATLTHWRRPAAVAAAFELVGARQKARCRCPPLLRSCGLILRPRWPPPRSRPQCWNASSAS